MENNQNQQIQEIIEQLQMLIVSAVNVGVPVLTLQHLVNTELTNVDFFNLDDDESAEFASRNQRAWGA